MAANISGTLIFWQHRKAKEKKDPSTTITTTTTCHYVPQASSLVHQRKHKKEDEKSNVKMKSNVNCSNTRMQLVFMIRQRLVCRLFVPTVSNRSLHKEMQLEAEMGAPASDLTELNSCMEHRTI